MTGATLWRFSLVLVAAGCASTSDAGSPSATEPAETPVLTAPATTAASTSTSLVEMATSSTLPPDVVEVRFSATDEVMQPLVVEDTKAEVRTGGLSVNGDLDGAVTSTTITVQDQMVGVGWFEGTVEQCGTGGMALRVATRPDGETGWEIVVGQGTGDLDRVGGGGTRQGAEFVGSIDCSDQLDAGYVTTELLMPIPETGTGPSEGGWHIVKTWNNHDLTPESTPSNLPTSDLVLGEYFTDKGTATMYQLFLWTPEDVDGGLVNSYVSFAFWSGGQCGHDAVTRTIAYDLELETFNGAWDNPPSLNGGDYAAGYFRNHYEGDARYVCG